MGYRNYIKNHSTYEVTVHGNFGKTNTSHMTGAEIAKLFGRAEANEALNGYSPNITIFKL